MKCRDCLIWQNKRRELEWERVQREEIFRKYNLPEDQRRKIRQFSKEDEEELISISDESDCPSICRLVPEGLREDILACSR